MDAKLCAQCGEIKSISHFTKQPDTEDGRKPICRACYRSNYRREHEGRRSRDRQAQKWTRPATGQKRCFDCKQTLPVLAFGQDIKRADGLQARCNKCSNFLRKTTRLRVKSEVLAHYANGTAHCVCCQEWRIEFLQIDHIAGDGAAHKRSIGWHGKSSDAFYRWLKMNDYPSGFRTLCANCNTALGYFGYCPHQLEDKETVR